MIKKWLAGVSLLLVLVIGGFYIAKAQMGGGGSMGGRQQQMRPMSRPQMGMMGGGSSAMVAQGKYIYVFSGSTLYKISPLKMEIVKELALKSTQKRQPRPRMRDE